MNLRKLDMRKLVAITATLITAGSFVKAEVSSTTVTLGNYLEQVSRQNQSFISFEKRQESAVMQVRENDLTLSPNIFSNAQIGSDSKLSAMPIPLLSYDRVDTQNYSVGLKQNTRYGTSLSVSYDVDYTNYVNMPGSSGPFYDARPVVEISQPLWQNGFGKSTRAQLSATEAKWQVENYTAQAGMRNMLLDAQITYWNLVIARETVKVQEKNLKRSEDIFSYVSDMAKKNLYEKSDVIQAQASLESSRLELKSAKDDEHTALRSFNALKNVPPGTSADTLSSIELESLEAVAVPVTHAVKAEVKVAEYQAKSTAEQLNTSIDQNEPSLALYGSYALNGRDSTVSDALSSSYSSGKPTGLVGLKFSMPFDQGAVLDVKKGLQKQSESSTLQYKQKLADQEQEWAELCEKLTDSCERLKMAITIEKLQKDKLENERVRLQQGRTTTYQVLLFEQDHLQSELSFLRAASTVLTLRAKLTVFQN